MSSIRRSELKASLHLELVTCRSCIQLLAAAQTCIPDAPLAVATRLLCVFHMTIVGPIAPVTLLPGGCRGEGGLANMIHSSHRRPDERWVE